MAISSEVRKNVYVLNGVLTEFDYTFKIISSDEIKVSVVNATTGTEVELLVLDSDYTVSGAGDEEGGTITYAGATAYDSDYNLVILGSAPFTQPIDLINNDNSASFNQTVEDGLDRVTILTQQLKEQISRAVVQNPNSSTQVVMPALEANKILGANAAGSALEFKTVMDSDAQAAAELAADEAEAAQAAAELAQSAAESARDEAVSISGWEVATQEEAEAGTDNTKLMTPLRSKQSFDELITDAKTTISTTHLTASTPSTVSGATWVAMTDMTANITPTHASNPILILLTGRGSNNTAGKELEVAIRVDGSIANYTLRYYAPFAANESGNFASQMFITLSVASHTIEAVFRASAGGTSQVVDRAMTIIEFKQNN